MEISILNLLLLKRAIAASCWKFSSITSFYKFDVIVKSRTLTAVEFFFSRRMSSYHSERLITDLYFENLLCRVLGRYFVPILSLEAVDDFNF
jgi:hypothetical protein